MKKYEALLNNYIDPDNSISDRDVFKGEIYLMFSEEEFTIVYNDIRTQSTKSIPISEYLNHLNSDFPQGTTIELQFIKVDYNYASGIAKIYFDSYINQSLKSSQILHTKVFNHNKTKISGKILSITSLEHELISKDSTEDKSRQKPSNVPALWRWIFIGASAVSIVMVLVYFLSKKYNELRFAKSVSRDKLSSLEDITESNEISESLEKKSDNTRSQTSVLKLIYEEERYGFVNQKGQIVVPIVYSEAKPFSEGLSVVADGGKYGYVNETGKIIIPIEYDIANSFSEGLAVVLKDKEYGYIDKSGKMVMLFEYDFIDSFVEGMAVVAKNEKHGYIDKSGNKVVDLLYDYADSFSEGLARVYTNGKYGFINKEGEMLIPQIYGRVDPFSEGLAAVSKDEKWGFINHEGKIVIPMIYDDVDSFSEGLATVSKDDMCGFIDSEGKRTIAFTYDYADSFSEGYAPVMMRGKYGYIDKKERLVIPFFYDSATRFSGGLAVVRKNKENYLINKSGVFVRSCDVPCARFVNKKFYF